jgi:hypothetical protein
MLNIGFLSHYCTANADLKEVRVCASLNSVPCMFIQYRMKIFAPILMTSTFVHITYHISYQVHACPHCTLHPSYHNNANGFCTKKDIRGAVILTRRCGGLRLRLPQRKGRESLLPWRSSFLPYLTRRLISAKSCALQN